MRECFFTSQTGMPLPPAFKRTVPGRKINVHLGPERRKLVEPGLNPVAQDQPLLALKEYCALLEPRAIPAEGRGHSEAAHQTRRRGLQQCAGSQNNTHQGYHKIH